MYYAIRKLSTTNKEFDVNEQEEYFFEKLYANLSSDVNKNIYLNRMSDGTLAVYYKSYPIGKIKLQGRKYHMQILKGLYTVKSIEGNIDDFIEHIPEWQTYIRIHCK